MRHERLFLVNFSVKIRQQDHVALIDVCGHLTFFEVRALRDSVQSLLREKRKNILLNLSELKYLDSSGIGELARIYVAVVKQGGAMKVVGLAPKVEEILKITHLSQVFQEWRRNSKGAASLLRLWSDDSPLPCALLYLNDP